MLQITIDTPDRKQNLKVMQEKNKNTTRERCRLASQRRKRYM